jgi:hypothetical protein
MNKHKKNKSKGQSLGNHKFYKAIKWHKFSGRNHIAKSAMLPNTCWLVPKQSLKDVEKAKRSYEAYFNDKSNEATTLGKIPEEVEMPNLTVADYIDMENTVV